MQFSSCIYTAQGEYVCQKNSKLDSFYNKTIVEGFNNGAAPTSLPTPASAPTCSISTDKVNKLKNTINQSCFGADKSTRCPSALVNLYHQGCLNKNNVTCLVTKKGSIPACNDGFSYTDATAKFISSFPDATSFANATVKDCDIKNVAAMAFGKC